MSASCVRALHAVNLLSRRRSSALHVAWGWCDLGVCWRRWRNSEIAKRSGGTWHCRLPARCCCCCWRHRCCDLELQRSEAADWQVTTSGRSLLLARLFFNSLNSVKLAHTARRKYRAVTVGCCALAPADRHFYGNDRLPVTSDISVFTPCILRLCSMQVHHD